MGVKKNSRVLLPTAMEHSPGSFLSPDRKGSKGPQLNEAAYESQDRWGESPSPERSAASTCGSPWRSKAFQPKLHSSSSEPTLAGTTWYSHSPHSNTWYPSVANQSISSPTRSQWSPLGSTWREREKDVFGVPVRKNADEANAFINGCVPNWSTKPCVRKAKTLEHELTWNYYRMSRHTLHPERESVGDPHMPNECVVSEMRCGKEKQFQFFRDLRPPFRVNSIKRDQEDSADKHPDGDLFYVSYQCGIDYVGERLWNEKCLASTFDNMISGTASVRIPDGYPKQQGIKILNWGRPTLTPDEQKGQKGIATGDTFINPNTWMPISAELSQRSSEPRFAKCREATRQAHAGIRARRPLEVDPVQKLLLGTHTTLPRLAAAHHAKEGTNVSSPSAAQGVSVEGATPSQKKKRQHCIFTAAAGFVRYAG